MAKEVSPSSLSDVYKKEKRRRRRIILSLFLLIVYGIFLGGAWLVVRSPFFQIQKIEINGNQKVSSGDIVMLVTSKMFDGSFWKRALGFRNIIVWPKIFSLDDLRFLPELKSISVQKNYGERNILVNVEERQSFGVWCFVKSQTNFGEIQNFQSLEIRNSNLEIGGEASCWWFDYDGVLFRRALNVEGNLIKVVDDYSQDKLGLGSKILPPEFITNIFSIFRVISDSDLSVQEIRLNDLRLQEIEVDAYAGPKLYFSLRFPADNTLAVIQSLKNQPGFDKLEYIDFRVENRTYYK